MKARTSTSIAASIAVLALALLLNFTAAARAVEPTFPPASRFGLVPPPGMTPSTLFPGFADVAHKAAIIINILPGPAYDELANTAEDALKKQGISIEKSEPLQVGLGKGMLITGTQTAPDQTLVRKWLLLAAVGGFTAVVKVEAPAHGTPYTDDVVRTALATLAIRATVPDAEKLSLVPFTVGNLAGFRVKDVIPGRALMLVDVPKSPHMTVSNGLPEYELDARLMIAVVPGAPQNAGGRARLARFAFNTIGGIKDPQFTMSEPVRINNQEGFETVAHATDAQTGSDVMVVQWLRFGDAGFLQVVGISRAKAWDAELARMRTLRDSIVLK